MPAIRLIKHEVIPGSGSYEVRYEDGQPSVYFNFEDLPGRRLRPDLVDSETALGRAKAFARGARTNEDKRRAVMTMLNDEEWSTW